MIERLGYKYTLHSIPVLQCCLKHKNLIRSKYCRSLRRILRRQFHTFLLARRKQIFTVPLVYTAGHPCFNYHSALSHFTLPWIDLELMATCFTSRLFLWQCSQRQNAISNLSTARPVFRHFTDFTTFTMSITFRITNRRTVTTRINKPQ